jgi:ABC-2 type transport system ATP-binding protein
MRAAGTIRVELQGTSKTIAKKLSELPGVRKVSSEKLDESWQAHTLRIESNSDAREAVIELAFKEHWKLRDLHLQLPSLEDVFVELAAGDPPPKEELVETAA